ncbi:glycosyltransferase family 2 protein [Nostoc sp. ATCC 53789]|uniref:glycosyltransferase family 2 protein n=1 Tax=Nostoc sp. ATCC 53789 TaxID=76335 RepID=UPI000DECB901|nr:glycosyltransferase family 2 protein [Nostoc sp. ATCC 53789]QHG15285.1 glycosyl transferase [Nostoc sp. ATCC 53789]RCJ16590.1 glycosyl transferase [Nostoc sp. ATCC 53789]
MNIYGMCLVKNEDDIIIQTLKSATKWCDYIYVYDNGSTDKTWEKVLELSQIYKQIIPYKQENDPFSDDLRSEIFNNYRINSSEEDWWCRLDADEIYIDDPRIFLAKVPQEYILVVNASFEYYFTDKDLKLYNQNPSSYADYVPVEQKCRYYINNWSELRFIRYRKDWIWGENDGGWPSAVWQNPIYPVRIWLKHYQYRSPQQIQKRIETRREAIVNRSGFCHEAQANWKGLVFDQSNLVSDFEQLNIQDIPNDWTERIVEASKLHYDTHDRKFVVCENLMPKIEKQQFIINKPRFELQTKLLNTFHFVNDKIKKRF